VLLCRLDDYCHVQISCCKDRDTKFITIALRVDSTVLEPRAGSRVVRIDPLRFPGRMSYKATKPDLALPVVYLSIFYCIVVYHGPFICIVSFRCYVFCLLVVLVEYLVYLPSDWLGRLL